MRSARPFAEAREKTGGSASTLQAPSSGRRTLLFGKRPSGSRQRWCKPDRMRASKLAAFQTARQQLLKPAGPDIGGLPLPVTTRSTTSPEPRPGRSCGSPYRQYKARASAHLCSNPRSQSRLAESSGALILPELVFSVELRTRQPTPTVPLLKRSPINLSPCWKFPSSSAAGASHPPQTEPNPVSRAASQSRALACRRRHS